MRSPRKASTPARPPRARCAAACSYSCGPGEEGAGASRRWMMASVEYAPPPHVPGPPVSAHHVPVSSQTLVPHHGSQVDDRLRRGRKEKERAQERAEKERIRKEHARKVLEEQKIQKARRKWQKQTEFLCTIKFRNTLPDPPLGPHFLEMPLNLDKFVEYAPTSLETNYKWQLHCERDLGVDIDVIDPRNYLLPTNPPPLDPADAELLDWHGDTSNQQEDHSLTARRRKVDTGVTWLKKTTYLTNDPYDPVHKFKTEREAQASAQERLNSQMTRVRDMDRKKLVQDSFMHANGKKSLVHQSKKEVTAEWVMPVMPDLSLWPNTYTHVAFDHDPAADTNIGGSKAGKRKRFRQSVVTSVKHTKNTDGDVVLTGSCLVPAAGPDTDNSDEDEEPEGASPAATTKYGWAKDYQMNIVDYAQTRFDGNPHLLFVVDNEREQATFCKLSAKVELSNLPRSQAQYRGRGAVVVRRDLSAEETRSAREKLGKELLLQGGSDSEDFGGTPPDLDDDRQPLGGPPGVDADGDQESLLTEVQESEGSNMAVKGTESSEGDEGTESKVDSDDDDL